MNILFWNTNKKALHTEIYDLVEEYEVSILILVENIEEEEITLVEKLRYFSDFKFVENKIFKKARIYFDDPIIGIEEVHGHTRYGIYSIELIDHKRIILGVVHFPSKLNWGNSGDHLGLCVQLRSDIETIEKAIGIKNTFIVGDFNMNPFEEGLVNASGLNNVNVKSIALNRLKNIYKVNYDSFYNPMWNFFGEFSRGKTPGTHFYNSAKYINHYWNIYDQVMIRPELLHSFMEDELDIVTKIKGSSLLKIVNNIEVVDSSISDHLPLFLKFNIFKL